jgi:hypothetical protein
MNSSYSDYAEGDHSAPMPEMLYSTQQLHKAEALARNGQLAQAAAIVDLTRVGKGNMAPASTTDQNALLEQIWYEHAIENYYVCGSCLYFFRRGWGPLAPTTSHHWGHTEGTPLHYPPPGEELEVLQHLNYTYGGVGNEGGTLQPVSAEGMRNVFRVPARAIYAFDGVDDVKAKLEYLGLKRGGLRVAPDNVQSLVRH